MSIKKVFPTTLEVRDYELSYYKRTKEGREQGIYVSAPKKEEAKQLFTWLAEQMGLEKTP